MRIPKLQQLPLVAAAALADGGAVAVATPAPSRTRTGVVAYAAPNFWRFAALAGQLACLLAVFRLYHLETVAFSQGLYIIFGTFLVHYWLPLRYKELFLVAVSISASFYVLGPVVAALLIAAGLTFFLILRSPLAFRWRILLLTAAFGALLYGCLTKRLPIPATFYPVFGAIFMFRTIVYAYDLSHQKEPARLLPFLSYFFILPNYYFTLFPVIDFQTMRRTYYQRDFHEIAQQGIRWMARGAVQLTVYRLVFYLNDRYLPDRVTTLGALAATMVLTYLLYMNVSGHFHLIVGTLHLFGYDLPETNRRYLLASGLTDYWRRANIYWKDFMVKIVYLPAYFKLHKRGNKHAQILATAGVFLVTWALHLYQSVWLLGQWTFSWPDAIFWSALGGLVIITVAYENRHKRRGRDLSWRARGIHAIQVLATFSLMCVLWSVWSAPSMSAWAYLVTHWTHGR